MTVSVWALLTATGPWRSLVGKVARVLSVLVVLVAVAGCAIAVQGHGSARVVVGVGDAVPVVWTAPVAAQRLSALEAVVNLDGSAFLALRPTATLATYQREARLVAADEGTMAQGLAAGRWPANARAVVAGLRSALLQEQYLFSAVAAATSVASVTAMIAHGSALIDSTRQWAQKLFDLLNG